MAQRKQHDQHKLEKNLLIAKLWLAAFVTLVQFMYLLTQDPIVYIMTNLSVILGYLLDVIPSAFKRGLPIVRVGSWICLIFYSIVVLFSFLAFFYRIDILFEKLKDTFLGSFFNTYLPILSFIAVSLQFGYFFLMFRHYKKYE